MFYIVPVCCRSVYCSINMYFLFQLVTDESTGIGRMLYSYISDFWNFLDLLTILLFIAGIVLQVLNCDDCFDASRIVLAINLMTFFFRILHIFSIHKELGPKLVMIGRMVSMNLFKTYKDIQITLLYIF